MVIDRIDMQPFVTYRDPEMLRVQVTSDDEARIIESVSGQITIEASDNTLLVPRLVIPRLTSIGEDGVIREIRFVETVIHWSTNRDLFSESLKIRGQQLYTLGDGFRYTYMKLEKEMQGLPAAFTERPSALSELMSEVATVYREYIQVALGICRNSTPLLGEDYDKYFARIYEVLLRNNTNMSGSNDAITEVYRPEFHMMFQGSFSLLMEENLQLLPQIHQVISKLREHFSAEGLSYEELIKEENLSQLMDVLTKGPNGFVVPLLRGVLENRNDQNSPEHVGSLFRLWRDELSGEVKIRASEKLMNMFTQVAVLHRVNKTLFTLAKNILLERLGDDVYVNISAHPKLLHAFGRQQSCAAHSNSSLVDTYFTNGFNELLRAIHSSYYSS